MKRLHLQGWLCYDSDGLIALKSAKNKSENDAHCIQKDIFEFASDTSTINSYYYDSPAFGGQRATIPNAFIRIYATKKECSLEEAEGALVSQLYGFTDNDMGCEGYSEFTITGYYNKTFSIGGHNLAVELEKYLGKYIHFVLECADKDAIATTEKKQEDINVNKEKNMISKERLEMLLYKTIKQLKKESMSENEICKVIGITPEEYKHILNKRQPTNNYPFLKCKAKSVVDGKWVIGNYIKTTDAITLNPVHLIIPEKSTRDMECNISGVYEIDPTTLCVYTGKIVNMFEIYTNDVIAYYNGKGDLQQGVVVWLESGEFAIKFEDKLVKLSEWDMSVCILLGNEDF